VFLQENYVALNLVSGDLRDRLR